MSGLLCLVGIHRPVLPGEWNLGYCFSTCRHCDRDMVRSVLDGWKAPRKFKVVRAETLTAYDDLDAFLRARERPRAEARKIEPGPGLPARGAPSFAMGSERRPPPAVRAGTPFDFSDFEPGAPGATPPPLKNVQNG